MDAPFMTYEIAYEKICAACGWV